MCGPEILMNRGPSEMCIRSLLNWKPACQIFKQDDSRRNSWRSFAATSLLDVGSGF